jgi:hypothetical protein
LPANEYHMHLYIMQTIELSHNHYSWPLYSKLQLHLLQNCGHSSNFRLA